MVMKTNSLESPGFDIILEPRKSVLFLLQQLPSCKIASTIRSHHATVWTACTWQSGTSAGQEASRASHEEGIYKEYVNLLPNLVNIRH